MKTCTRLVLPFMVTSLLAGAVQANDGRIVVANRASGNLSVIDVATDQVTHIKLPEGARQAEPMYVVYVAGRVLVGDRANSRIVAYDPDTFQVVGQAGTGTGIWHMWADPLGTQLWIACDGDNNATVLHARTLQEIRRVPMPADLVASGGRPHDVILDPFLPFAYVTIAGVQGENDFVIKFSTVSFAELGRAAVGKDPHLSLTGRDSLLYVPCQNSSAVYVLNRSTLTEVNRIPVPAAHGAGMAPDGQVFYTTNITGGGPQGLVTIATGTRETVGLPVDTPHATPHNIALTLSGEKLYLTHSGAAADKVSIYTITPETRVPVLARVVTVGLNPFGLALVP
jgi:DNA-binding beta-propeller fold protein YncE